MSLGFKRLNNTGCLFSGTTVPYSGDAERLNILACYTVFVEIVTYVSSLVCQSTIHRCGGSSVIIVTALFIGQPEDSFFIFFFRLMSLLIPQVFQLRCYMNEYTWNNGSMILIWGNVNFRSA